MKELEITCQSPVMILRDLGRTLTRGDLAVFSEEEVAGSDDLSFAIKSGAVSAKWRNRCHVVVPQNPKPKPSPPTYTPPYVQRLKPTRLPDPEVEIPVAPQVLREIVREIVQEVVHEEFQSIRDLIAHLVVKNGGKVEQFVQQDVQQEVQAGDELVAVFIPTIKKSGKVELSIDAAETQTTNLADAANALSAIRKAG